MNPLVSIGLPVYNGEAYLGRALDSIQGQTLGDWELVVSDNGSSDATADIVKERAADDGRITYVRQAVNRGAAYNFSVVVEHARAPYFKWATHDDEMDLTMLERLVEFARAEPDAVMWYPLAVEIDDQNELRDILPDGLPLSQPEPADRLRQLLDTYRGSNPLFGIHRTAQLRTTRLLDDFHSSDVVLLAEIALRGRMLELDEPLFHRRWMFRSTRGRTQEEIDQWFNPESNRHHDFKMTRLVRELGRSILAGPLTPQQRRACMGVLYSTWGRRYWRHIGAEFRSAAQRALGMDVAEAALHGSKD